MSGFPPVSVAPAAALEGVYGALLLVFAAKIAFGAPPLRRVYAGVAFYVLVRLVALALRLVLATQTPTTVVSVFVSESIFFSAGYFIIVASATTATTFWLYTTSLPPLDLLFAERVRSLARLMQIAGVVLGVYGGITYASAIVSSPPDAGAISQSQSLRYAASALFLCIVSVLEPVRICMGLRALYAESAVPASPVSAAAASPAAPAGALPMPVPGKDGAPRPWGAVSRRVAGAGVLLLVCACLVVRVCLAFVNIATPSESEAILYGARA